MAAFLTKEKGSTTSPDSQQSICLVRHGRSLAQGVDRHLRKSERFLDCHLSPTGVSQAYGVPGRLIRNGGLSGIELVVVSPLTRALMTALLAFRDRPEVPIVVHPDCREVRLCATASSLNALLVID